jgi:hypothetical protein
LFSLLEGIGIFQENFRNEQSSSAEKDKALPQETSPKAINPQVKSMMLKKN